MEKRWVLIYRSDRKDILCHWEQDGQRYRSQKSKDRNF
jgi:hypothetical protein